MLAWNRADVLKTVFLCAAVAVLANAGFLLVRLADSAIPREPVAEAIREAFKSGTMDLVHYPPDLMKGADQYTDCVTMQVTLLGGEGVWANALAPRIASPENFVPGLPVPSPKRAWELKLLAEGELDLARVDTYTRFWHGQSTCLGLALNFLSLDGYRSLLLLTTLALMAAAAAAAASQGRRLLMSLAPLFLVSFLLCGQTHYGQLVSFAPAQISCWTMVLLLIVSHDRLKFAQWLLLATLAGALEAFTDMMISIPLVAGTFLITAGTLLALRSTSLPATAASMLALASTWTFGFGATYISKLGLTSAVLGWQQVLTPFITQLKSRVGTSDPETRMPDDVSRLGLIRENIDLLSRNSWHLGYTNSYSELAVDLIKWLAIFGWAYALWRLLRAYRSKQTSSAIIAGAGYVAASVFLLVWVAVFPEHTWRHSQIAVRGTVIWIAAGWGWALTERALRQRDDGARSPAVDGSASS